jgi:SSS family solute:Na+ symporter
VQAYISPPIAAVFLLGVLWRRATSQGALAALVTGLVLGLSRLVLELNRGSLSGAAEWLATINFLHYAILLFAICSAVLVIVSLLTKAPSTEQVGPLTVHYHRRRGEATPGFGIDVAVSLGVVALVVAAWVHFS